MPEPLDFRKRHFDHADRGQRRSERCRSVCKHLRGARCQCSREALPKLSTPAITPDCAHYGESERQSNENGTCCNLEHVSGCHGIHFPAAAEAWPFSATSGVKNWGHCSKHPPGVMHVAFEILGRLGQLLRYLKRSRALLGPHLKAKRCQKIGEPSTRLQDFLREMPARRHASSHL
jgi:hypothetical protein